MVTVEDTGTGIEPKHMERIFEAFFTTKSSGMGMGLSICRSIIEAHGGRLSGVGRQLRMDRCFSFVLPAPGACET